MFSRLFHAVTCTGIPFLFINEYHVPVFCSFYKWVTVHCMGTGPIVYQSAILGLWTLRRIPTFQLPGIMLQWASESEFLWDVFPSLLLWPQPLSATQKWNKLLHIQAKALCKFWGLYPGPRPSKLSQNCTNPSIIHSFMNSLTEHVCTSSITCQACCYVLRMVRGTTCYPCPHGV